MMTQLRRNPSPKKRMALVALSSLLCAGLALGAVLPPIGAASAGTSLTATQPAAPAPAKTGLVYDLWQDAEHLYRLHLTVANPTGTVIELTFPTGQDYDLVLYRQDQVAWRASAGQMYTQATRTVRLAPGAVLNHTIELPASLARGVYRADALFAADRATGIAASLWLWLPGQAERPAPADPLAQLRYSLAWDPAERGRLVFTVTNRGSGPVELTFPTAMQFDVVARRAPRKPGAQAGDIVWRASEGQMYAQSMVKVTLAPGRSLGYRVELPKLPAGSYQFDAYFAADRSGEVAASLKHVVVKDTFLYGLRVKNGKVNFWLYNGSGRTQQLRFQDEKAYRLVLVDPSGREVWSVAGTRFSGRSHGVEPIRRGVTMNYVTSAPDPAKLGLAPGVYTLKAYFLGTSAEGPQATCEFVVGR